MSTRGLYGFRKDGVDKLTYNHSDSYPERLGKKISIFCATNTVEQMKSIYDHIVMIDESVPPTKVQIQECVKAGYYDGRVSERSTDDWYCLLRNLQGNFDELSDFATGNKKVYMSDNSGFIKDSLFCEYAYIINLDEETLEFYTGYQRKPCKGNRYGEEKDEGNDFYPCKMVLEIPLKEITPVNTTVEKMAEAAREDDDE